MDDTGKRTQRGLADGNNFGSFMVRSATTKSHRQQFALWLPFKQTNKTK